MTVEDLKAIEKAKDTINIKLLEIIKNTYDEVVDSVTWSMRPDGLMNVYFKSGEIHLMFKMPVSFLELAINEIPKSALDEINKEIRKSKLRYVIDKMINTRMNTEVLWFEGIDISKDDCLLILDCLEV